MDHMLEGLNRAQKEAVASPSSVLQVLAPPGSGKTKTLTARVAWLIARQNLVPQHIIVCTFTVKAAKEMRERVESLLGPEVADSLILGTFHSVARRLLAIHGHRCGLEKKFGIADSSDSMSIIKRVIKANGLTILPAVARHRISNWKARGVSVTQAVALDRKPGSQNAPIQEAATAYRAYEEHLGVANLLDYDDLLVRCVDLLTRFPECVSNVQAVLIDEFQDTNHIQYELMRLFAQYKRNISVVGDPDQSIYGWRAAEAANIQKMQSQYPATQVVNLSENYRSAGCILLAAQEVIEQDKARLQKSLMPTHCAGERPTLRRLHDAQSEAMWIVSEILRAKILTAGLLRFNDFAVLLRTSALSRHIETAMGQAGMPYRMVGGQRFFDRVEVKLLLDYLRVLDHPDHTDALLRVINVPSRGIGDSSLKLLTDISVSKRVPLWTVVLKAARGELATKQDISRQAQKGLELFVNHILTLRKKLEEPSDCSVVDYIYQVISKIGVLEWLQRSYPEKSDHEARWANVEELIVQASEVTSLENSESTALHPSRLALSNQSREQTLTLEEKLSSFLSNVALASGGAEKGDRDSASGRVTLSTMHAAKGLEWATVFIPAVHNGSIPHSRTDDHDEERRLLYVAMTRAKVCLFMSCPGKDSMGVKTSLSSFLSDGHVGAHLIKQGPSYTTDLVRQMQVILGRQDQVLDLKGTRKVKELRSLEDDQWPDGSKSETEEEEYIHQQVSFYERGHGAFARPLGSSRGSSFSKRERGDDDGGQGFTSAAKVHAMNVTAASTSKLSTSFTSARLLPRDEPVQLSSGGSLGRDAKRPRIDTQAASRGSLGSARSLLLVEQENMPRQPKVSRSGTESKPPFLPSKGRTLKREASQRSLHSFFYSNQP